MNRVSGFEFLPNELYHRIQEQIFENKTLLSLILVSKHFYSAFLPYIYHYVNSLALGTLALSDNERFPLGPHPATFVKEMSFEIPYRKKRIISVADAPDEEETESGGMNWKEKEIGPTELLSLQKQLTAAIRNIRAHASSSAVRRFTYSCSALSLPDAFGNVEFAEFGALKDVGVFCSFPSRNLRKSLAMLKALCSASTLTGLELIFPRLEHAPDSTTQAKILLQTAKTCPNLKRLAIGIPRMDPKNLPSHSPEHVQRALDNPEFTFSALRLFAFSDFGLNPGKRALDCTSFFRRHPTIEWLEFNSSESINHPSHGGGSAPDILPNLKIFHGYLEDYISLCTESRPINEISLSLLDLDEEEPLFEGALKENKTLRRLFMHDHRLPYTVGRDMPGYSVEVLRKITDSSPGLTHFDCWADCEASRAEHLRSLYRMLATNLPNLTHLRMVMCLPIEGDTAFSINEVGLQPYIHDLREAHLDALNWAMRGHGGFKTARVEIYALLDKSYLNGMFYFMKKGRVRVSGDEEREGGEGKGGKERKEEGEEGQGQGQGQLERRKEIVLVPKEDWLMYRRDALENPSVRI
ncbi:hypothetical protein GYMLUDRAFT_74882 [Collybiopsis luxurians FD-317 M1]|uniref:Unplaced genomic scaffold GYMLUscaffold_36, whole genome shotgun sequence n=1 Tax=Collybiopsis luxurians FD-317 M1 TaxID=944289 RepID=A0A0D0CSH9_9AGAR|nr:hypothetical protein GYMLUDRAFT_74882 [Collybiopsis luxurians FD-317 M1]